MAFDYFRVDWDEVDVPEATQFAFERALGAWIVPRALWLIWDRPDFDYRSLIASRYNELYHLFNSPGIRSPIEQQLIGWLVWLDGEALGPIAMDQGWIEGDLQLDPDEWRLLISPQHCIGEWRVDFLIAAHYRGAWAKIVIECDGHDFHEKTKEQAARDKRRDRDLVAAGCKVLRFTGSEIYRDPRACFVQIQDIVHATVHDLAMSTR